jgi:hypothetical protein
MEFFDPDPLATQQAEVLPGLKEEVGIGLPLANGMGQAAKESLENLATVGGLTKVRLQTDSPLSNLLRGTLKVDRYVDTDPDHQVAPPLRFDQNPCQLSALEIEVIGPFQAYGLPNDRGDRLSRRQPHDQPPLRSIFRPARFGGEIPTDGSHQATLRRPPSMIASSTSGSLSVGHHQQRTTNLRVSFQPLPDMVVGTSHLWLPDEMLQPTIWIDCHSLHKPLRL